MSEEQETGMPPEETEHPVFAMADTPVHGGQALAGAEDLIERAIDSVLEQVPVPEGPDEEPEGAAKLQPWAETAAPPSKNKRPLAELLEQFAERVRANPDALAGRPRGQHPAVAFFARFTPVGAGRGESAGGAGRKRRGRRGRGAEGAPAQPQPAQAAATVAAPGQPGTGGRRRRRRGGGAGAGAGAPAGAAPAGGRQPRQPAQRPQGQRPASGTAGPQAQGEARRRSRGRGRRRRGGGDGAGGNGGGGGAP